MQASLRPEPSDYSLISAFALDDDLATAMDPFHVPDLARAAEAAALALRRELAAFGHALAPTSEPGTSASPLFDEPPV